MEGRWARLAVRAQRLGALDYAKRPSRDRDWLAKEALILRDLERTVIADAFKSAMPAPRVDIKSLHIKVLELEAPWLAAKADGPSQEDLIEMYNEVIGEDG